MLTTVVPTYYTDIIKYNVYSPYSLQFCDLCISAPHLLLSWNSFLSTQTLCGGLSSHPWWSRISSSCTHTHAHMWHTHMYTHTQHILSHTCVSIYICTHSILLGPHGLSWHWLHTIVGLDWTGLDSHSRIFTYYACSAIACITPVLQLTSQLHVSAIA